MAVQQQQQQNQELLGKAIDLILDAITGFNATITHITIYGKANSSTGYRDYSVGLNLQNGKLLLGCTVMNNNNQYRLYLDESMLQLDQSLTVLLDRLWERITNTAQFINIVKAFSDMAVLSTVDMITVSCNIEL